MMQRYKLAPRGEGNSMETDGLCALSAIEYYNDYVPSNHHTSVRWLPQWRHTHITASTCKFNCSTDCEYHRLLKIASKEAVNMMIKSPLILNGGFIVLMSSRFEQSALTSVQVCHSLL
jgi:hypothetical protein